MSGHGIVLRKIIHRVAVVFYNKDFLLLKRSARSGMPRQQSNCLVRYDNEAGKGDHKHIEDREQAYQFVDTIRC